MQQLLFYNYLLWRLFLFYFLFFTICWILYHEKDTFIGTSNIYFIDNTDLEVC